MRLRETVVWMLCIFPAVHRQACYASAGPSDVIVLEHSFDGVSFSPFASIEASDSQFDDRNKISRILVEGYDDILSRNKELLLSSSRYYVRSGDALASVPATCWAAAGEEAEILLHAFGSGTEISAITIEIPPCHIVSENGNRRVDLPKLDSVYLVRPEQAPQIVLPVAKPGEAQQKQASMTVDDGPKKDSSENDKKSPPAKDERSWLQKNWLFVAVSLFILANRLGQQEGPPAGGTAGRANTQARTS